jgi:hypothetical protein
MAILITLSVLAAAAIAFTAYLIFLTSGSHDQKS